MSGVESVTAGSRWWDRLAAWSAPVVPIAAAAICYLPIRHGCFIVDDFIHLYRRVNDPFLLFVLRPGAGHLLMGWKLAVAATHALFGATPAGYFWVVLLAHLLAVGLLFRAAARLAASRWIAAVVALAWGTAPMHLGTLGWLSVSGQVLATVLLLFVLSSMAWVGTDEGTLGWRPWWWAGVLLYAATCFGTALATAIVAPGYAWLTLGSRDRWRAFRVLAPLVAVVPAVYVLDFWIWARLAAFPIGHSLELLRGISATHIVEMVAILATQGLAGLAGGPLTRPWDATALMALCAMAAAAALVALAVGSASERRRVTGLLLLAFAAYGTIAVGRADFLAALRGDHALALGGDPIDRYQYMASALLALAIGATTGILVRHAGKRARTPAWVGPLVLAVALLWTAVTPRDADFAHRATQWQQRTNDILGVMRREIMAAPPGGLAVLRNRHFAPVPLPPQMFPGWAGAFVVFFPRNQVAGRRVLFVDSRQAVLDATSNGRRTAGLIVATPPGAPLSPAGSSHPVGGG